jgi:hypothetical protein
MATDPKKPSPSDEDDDDERDDARDESSDEDDDEEEEDDEAEDDDEEDEPADDDEEDDDEAEEEEEDDEEAEAAPPPPPPPPKPEPAPASKRAKAESKAPVSKGPVSKGAKSKSAAAPPEARGRRRRVVQKRGSPTRNIILFVILVGGLAAAFGIFGSSGGDGGPAPAVKWKEGQVVPVEITIVTTDHKNLACATTEDLKGKYCAYEAQNRKNPKSQGDSRTEENLLQPFTTTDQVQFMAAGLWVDPILKAKLDKENWDRPSPRFSVTCQYTVEGRTNNAFVQWKPGEGWHPGNGWYFGTVKDCKIQ